MTEARPTRRTMFQWRIDKFHKGISVTNSPGKRYVGTWSECEFNYVIKH